MKTDKRASVLRVAVLQLAVLLSVAGTQAEAQGQSQPTQKRLVQIVGHVLPRAQAAQPRLRFNLR